MCLYDGLVECTTIEWNDVCVCVTFSRLETVIVSVQDPLAAGSDYKADCISSFNEIVQCISTLS